MLITMFQIYLEILLEILVKSTLHILKNTILFKISVSYYHQFQPI